MSTNITKKLLSISLSISILMISASILFFSITQAMAAPADRGLSPYQLQPEWRYVDNGKVYFFDKDGKLSYKLLSEALYKPNTIW